MLKIGHIIKTLNSLPNSNFSVIFFGVFASVANEEETEGNASYQSEMGATMGSRFGALD